MKTFTWQVPLFLSVSLLINVPAAKAGLLADKYAEERASAVAGALAAQNLLRPSIPASPFASAYRAQFQTEGVIRTPLKPPQMVLAKASLLWEYGPLSLKALQGAGHLSDAVMVLARENPALLQDPSRFQEEIARKVKNLTSRQNTFKGYQAEVHEAAYRGWNLTKDPQSTTFDLHDPKTGRSYQAKVYRSAAESLRSLRQDYADMAAKLPEKARFFNGMLPKDQIDELVAQGRLRKSSTPVEVGTRAGIRKQTAYIDPDTGTRIIALESEATAKEFAANVRKGTAVHERLSQRSAGFGSAVAGGAVLGGGISLIAQKMLGRNVSWAAVGTSTAVGAGSGGATVLAAQTIESHFGKQLAKSMIARKLLPGASRSVARSVLSGGLASAGVGAVVTLGFVAKDYYSGEISTTDALVQSGVGLGSVAVGVGAGIILASATAGSALGTPVPVIGNVVGFVGGLAAGTAAYLGGNWYYENFKAEQARAEMKAFKQGAAKWGAARLDQEIDSLKDEARSLRSAAALLLSN